MPAVKLKVTKLEFSVLRVSIHKVISTAGVAIALSSAMTCHAAPLNQQQEWYVQANIALDNGNYREYNALKPKLENYPLLPYLEYRVFRQDLFAKSPQSVENFLEKYQSLPFSITLKHSYLSFLARTQQWSDFLQIQPTLPKSKVMQCHYYNAKEETKQYKAAWQGAQSLWLTGSSLPQGCNNLLQQWQASGQLTNGLILDRMLLAYNNDNQNLLNYLDYKLSGSSKMAGQAMINLFTSPEGVGNFAKQSLVNAFNQQLTIAAYQRLANQNVIIAVQQFDQVVKGQHFDEQQSQSLAEYVANLLMYTPDPNLMAWRDNVINHSSNSELLNRRFRISMGNANWNNALHWLWRLPDHSTVRFKFWHAYLLDKTNHHWRAIRLYNEILGQRSYYSAAAATILGKPIDFQVKSIQLDSGVIAPFQANLNRVREFYALDYPQGAVSEWNYLLKGKTDNQKLMLADYAKQQGWSYLAVDATISGKLWDYLSLRFPVAYKWWFDFFGKKRGMRAATMMALSRQESAFNPNAQSYVGARGLMQLMPSTAEHTAEKIGYPYRGANSLFDPSVNIRLGCAYLKMMLDQYNDNRILAFASYNAGPTRVRYWKQASEGKLDAFAFVEAIPFTETRNYVENILMFELYYSKLMGRPLHLLTPEELNSTY